MRFLYRYYSNLEYIFDILENKQLYFSLPSEFKDPFDCLPKFSLRDCKTDGVEKWIEYLKLISSYDNPAISENEIDKLIENTLQGLPHPNDKWLLEADALLGDKIRVLLQGIRICCFSTSPRNQMLWQQYANNHNGLVFQFRISYMVDRSKIYDVLYYSKPRSLSEFIESFKQGITQPEEFAKFQYCSKSIEWCGEDEVRLFSEKKHIKFEDQMLSGIIIGKNVSRPLIDTLRTIVSRWQKTPAIFLEKKKLRIINKSLKKYINQCINHRTFQCI